MVESTTIKITNVVKDKLLELKVDNEGYSTIIANLLVDYEKLKADVEYLKEEKKNLYKLALKTSDSAALVNNIHKATYFIVKVVYDSTLENAEKLEQLKEYLSEMLASDKDSVIAAIDNILDMLATEEADVPEVLIQFKKYVLQLWILTFYFIHEIELKNRLKKKLF